MIMMEGVAAVAKSVPTLIDDVEDDDDGRRESDGSCTWRGRLLFAALPFGRPTIFLIGCKIYVTFCSNPE